MKPLNYTRFWYLLVLFPALTATNAVRDVSGEASSARTARTIRVPEDLPRVQAAIDAAADGDVVLVAPGVYHEQLRLRGKQITLASRFLHTRDQKDIERTVLDGQIAKAGGRVETADAVIDVKDDVGPKTRIVGFTIRNGDDGISCAARINIEHNRFIGNVDAIDYEGGGGTCRHNVFERNEDDGIDLDGPCAAVIENNMIRNNEDDGIEIRLHSYRGSRLRIVIRHNIIVGNEEDGIQVIDYPDVSDRVIRIERNVIANTSMAAIGCMADGRTKENYEAADIPERIEVINNTIVNNYYGITGGDSLVALNNVITGTRKTALKRVDGNSVVAYNLLWKNGTDDEKSNIEAASTLLKDPVLRRGYRPASGSPCIDAGTAEYKQRGKVLLTISQDTYTGRAPDLGAFEFRGP